MTDFTMPSLGADMQSGVLVEWLVAEGDTVHHGQSIAVVETAKGAIEVESFVDGVVAEIIHQPSDEEIEIGVVLARIRSENEADSVPSPAPAEELQPKPSVTTEPPSVHHEDEPLREKAKPRISPAARRLATELQVDLTKVTGTGPDGVIQRNDVERAHGQEDGQPQARHEVAPAKVVAVRTGRADPMRQAIASATSRSNREIPHYYLNRKINLQRALQWMAERNRSLPIQDRMLPVALLVWAVAASLRQVKDLNGFWLDDLFQPAQQIGIGFSVALKTGGLVMPVIKGEALDSPQQSMAELGRLISHSRSGKLRQSDMEGATISVTNLGDLGVDSVHGVIFPPQVAIVGFGRIDQQPWAEGDALTVRPVVTASLAADHRATDGLIGARFLQRLNCVLQEMEVSP